MNNIIEKVHPCYQKKEPWPFPTLNRYEYFLRIKDELKMYDYIIFMNANLIVQEKIEEKEILPTGKESLFVTLSPGPFDRTAYDFTYDRNPLSKAYIPMGEGEAYFAGGFNGGKANEYIALMEELSKNIIIDLERNIIAKWHDESHLNKYIYEHESEIKYKIISPAYLFPEDSKLPFEKKIIMLDKRKWGGYNKLRGIDEVRKDG